MLKSGESIGLGAPRWQSPAERSGLQSRTPAGSNPALGLDVFLEVEDDDVLVCLLASVWIMRGCLYRSVL